MSTCFKILIGWLLIFLNLKLPAQNKTETVGEKPTLVVGLVVDQLRNEIIYRYWDRFGNGGFKRLINRGFYFKNAQFNYIPTYTAPGHCSIYTGALPRTHGIIGNEWLNKNNGAKIYCVQDTNVKPVGSQGKKNRMSPKNQLCNTIGDELKLSSNGKSKVFSIGLKDRSAILPAGHAADGAFWFDDQSGNFVSSTWYMKKLPEWVEAFNNQKITKHFLKKDWNTLYPIDTYTASLADNNNYEELIIGKKEPVFPYGFAEAADKKQWSMLKSSPFGNSIVKDFAINCLKAENLGKSKYTDMLCVSFSAADIIAHNFGPRSVETEDMYLRLDKDIEAILDALDEQAGANNYIVFLSSDHGGADVPSHLKDQKMYAGYIYSKNILNLSRRFLEQTYQDSSLVLSVINEQIYLNNERLVKAGIQVKEAEDRLCAFLTTIEGIAEAYPAETLKHQGFDKADNRALLQNGYNHKLSGNICMIYQASWIDYGSKGTTHGSGYIYDKHVPLLFYGKGIKTGESYKYIPITAIAPTICDILRINRPNGADADPLNDFFK